MKKILLFLFCLLTVTITLSSCGGVDPVNYNDNLVNYSNIADSRIVKFNEKIDEIEDLDNFTDSIKVVGAITVDSLKADINKITALKQAKGSDDFKAATIAYVESLIDYTKVLTEEYSKITEETSDENFNKIEKLINESYEITIKKIEEMQNAQKAFAKTSNFVLK